MKYDPQVYGRRIGYYPSSEVFKNVDRSVYLLDRPSDAEFERRHKVIRKFMENKGLDCLLIECSAGGSAWQNVRWVTNCMPPVGNAYVVFPSKGEITLFSYFMWLVDPFRRAQTIIEDVRGGSPRDFGRMAVERIRELGYTKGKIGIVEVVAGTLGSRWQSSRPQWQQYLPSFGLRCSWKSRNG